MNRALAAFAVALVTISGLAACVASKAPPNVLSPVDGVVIAVDAVSLTDVRGFTLRTSDGRSLTFKLGDLENATQFSPSHLKEHQATSVPIRVWFSAENQDLIVYRLEDAPAPAGS